MAEMVKRYYVINMTNTNWYINMADIVYSWYVINITDIVNSWHNEYDWYSY